MQQNHARVTGFTGQLPPDSIVGDASRIAGRGRRRGLAVIRTHELAGAAFSPELPLARMEDAA